MTKKIKRIVNNLKKRFDTLYNVLESEEDKEDVSDIISYIEEKLEE